MDFSKLAFNLGLEDDEFMELAELFIETGSNDLEKLKLSIAKGDVTAVIESSHSIKGASGNLGFTDIYEISKKIEHNARSNSLDEAEAEALLIEEKLENLTTKVRKFIKECA